MNSRQRFLETMAYGRPDRVPLFMEGIRDQVFGAWNQPGLKAKHDLEQRFLSISTKKSISTWILIPN